MKKLAIAYYYQDQDSDQLNADVFVCDDKKDIVHEFFTYANKLNNWHVKKCQITEGDAGVYIQDILQDKEGNEYEVIIKPIKK